MVVSITVAFWYHPVSELPQHEVVISVTVEICRYFSLYSILFSGSGKNVNFFVAIAQDINLRGSRF